MSRRFNLDHLVVLSLVAVWACGKEAPKPTLTDLKLTRNADHKGYTVTGNLRLPPRAGFYDTTMTATFGDGCVRFNERLNSTLLDADTAQAEPISYQLDTTREIARVELSTVYIEPGSSNPVNVFSANQIVDPKLHPPSGLPDKPCSPTVAERKAAQRKLGKTNPDAADADAIDHMSRNEVVAIAINTAGFLCARITDLYPDAAGQIIAHCVKYRSGRGRATYRIDADGASVEEID